MAGRDEEEGSTSGKIVITGNVVLGMPSGLTSYCRQARPATAPFRHCQTRLRCIASALPRVLPDDRSKLAPATCSHVVATWQMIGAYEDVLARLIADGTDDLVGDLCIDTAAECTAVQIRAIPDEGLPPHRVLAG